jgi:hypothetical protein
MICHRHISHRRRLPGHYRYLYTVRPHQRAAGGACILSVLD